MEIFDLLVVGGGPGGYLCAERAAQKGMKVAVVVDSWERRKICPQGHIVDVLGMPGDNDTEMHAILAEFGLPYRFEPEVENAADSISWPTSRCAKPRQLL